METNWDLQDKRNNTFGEDVEKLEFSKMIQLFRKTILTVPQKIKHRCNHVTQQFKSLIYIQER